jgi:heterodisulfide reductase subunit A2
MKQEIRIGVYVCHCGLNISGIVNVKELANYANTLDSVVISRDYQFMCSEPGQNLIKKDIMELGLNRVVVASCSPRMHEPTFRNACQQAGLNPYLMEMANIREHCSWIHDDKEVATEKAKDLVRAAVRRVYYNEPLTLREIPFNPNTLVIGGGIAGIQASLDIANSKHKVYLVEKTPSIGGHMIQLDKTFPTLDCSACILTPKMAAVGQHPYIDLLTYSEIIEVSGYVGNFKVKINKKSRYVDENKCTGCGLCFEKCPIVMTNEFELGLSKRKAIYIPFPQAVPNKAVIDKQEERPCNAACVDACPVHTNVLGYVKLIQEERFKEAYQLIRDTNPLPAVCGRICYAPCEEACNRGQLDQPLNIRHLKRFVTDKIDIDDLFVPQVESTGKKVAIIGSGPGGLAAANDLALKGHKVTVFEALPEPGGMLRYAIPDYRLPKEILRKEISYIKKLGVEIKTGVSVGTNISLTEIKTNYHAVFIATGAQNGIRLNVDGEQLPGIIEGIEFLRKFNLGNNIEVDKTVAIIGGGNTAIDCARTAKRIGGVDVKIIYRRSRAEMPASIEEIAAVEKEGIKIVFLTAPKRFLSKNGKLSGIECIKMKLAEPDSSGRLQPVPIEGSEFIIPVNMVITALGQFPETEFARDIGLSLGKWGTIEIDPKSCSTNIDGIFAGGDAVTGPAYAIDAIAAGKRAASSINQYLSEGPTESLKKVDKMAEKLSDSELRHLMERFSPQQRVEARELPVEERVLNFSEVTCGFSPAEAIAEASRCLAGQIKGCFECHECEKVCEPKAINFEKKDEIIEVEVGSIIVATGYDSFNPSVISQYGYGRYNNVITGLEFERISSATGPTGGQILLKNGQPPQSVAIVHCVGSRDKNYHDYCSNICCMYSLKFAHLIKEKTNAEVYEMYIDMRCFGQSAENFYKRLSEEGVNFIRGKVARVTDRAETDDEQDKLIVVTEDTLLGKMIRIPVDLVILSTAIEARSDAEQLGRLLSIGRNADGFFMERHVKLAPVNTPTDGIFIVGCCQGPKDIPYTVAQASAGAAQALTMISKGTVEIEAAISVIDEEMCSGCKICIGLCPFNAISFDEGKSVSIINEALCKGCGTCAAACPSGAIASRQFTDKQLIAQLEGILA